MNRACTPHLVVAVHAFRVIRSASEAIACTQGRFAVTARTIAGLAELTSLRRLDTAYTVAPQEAPASLNEFAALTGARACVHLLVLIYERVVTVYHGLTNA